MRVLISGATGLIATEVSRLLEARGDTPVRLVRRPAQSANEVEWHPDRGYLAEGALEDIDAVVNLAGASIGKLPWTQKYKQQLVASRLDSTRTLVDAINAAQVKPKVFVSGSASGFYGDTGDRTAVESDSAGAGFLAELASKWEAEAGRVDPSVRLVIARTSMVMSQRLGALGRLLPLIKLGVGGPLGSGKQWWAWITLTDEARAILHLIDTQSATGAFNLVAPETSTCLDVVRALGKALGRPTIVPAPAFALQALLGEGADEVLLANQKLSSQKLAASGFVFEHADLVSAASWAVNR